MSKPITLYDVTVPVLKKGLNNLTSLLRKAEAYGAEKNVKPEVTLGARLALDMLPLSRQIQILSDNAKGATARLGGVDIPKYDDTETTFEELYARINKTLAFIDSVDPKGFEGAEGRDIVLQFGPNRHEFNGHTYLTTFVLPNFYFHLTVAYAILRHNGVPLGKTDFLA